MLLLLHHLYVVHGSSDHFQCKFHSVRILHTHLQAVGYSLSEGHSMTLMCRNVNIYLSGRNLQDLNSQRNSVLSLPIHTVFQVLNMHGILYFRIRNYQNCCLMMNCCFLCYWNCLNSSCCFLYYCWSCLNYWSCQNCHSLLYYSEMLPEVVSVFPLLLSSDALPLLFAAFSAAS